MIRIGFLGTGFICEFCCDEAQLSSKCVPYAVASRDLKRAQQFVESKKSKSLYSNSEPLIAYGSYEDLLKDESIDVVFIGLPTALCGPVALDAISYKKHVIVDKPFVNAQLVRDLHEAALKNRVAFMDGTHFVHSNRLKRVVDLVQSGHAGTVRVMTSAFTYPFLTVKDLENGSASPINYNIRFNPSLEPHGAIGDLGWYCSKVALCMLAFSKKPSKVFAAATWQNEALPNNEESSKTTELRKFVSKASCIVEFGDDGPSLHFDCDFGAGFRNYVEVAGTEKSLKIEDFVLPFRNSPFIPFRSGEPQSGPPDFNDTYVSVTTALCNAETGQFGANSDLNPEQIPVQAETSQITAMFDEMGRCVNTLKSLNTDAEIPRDVSHWGEEAFMTQVIVDALSESAKTGRPVVL
uniref:Gfo/Idh/MocA-like oxidoreductase N-terminal domain-containing protein n=1 Tax=Timspurckia oligopyrenoides TaxID=708627 RepID=A0A7S0ZG07_9RHOD|mmetsp:Transcript_3840/g.6709  ORF Transcript_3840/g.6709 Transcript_3840/m.6709 type:complete len:408 (+) Transcript_3840:163-1386(+)